MALIRSSKAWSVWCPQNPSASPERFWKRHHSHLNCAFLNTFSSHQPTRTVHRVKEKRREEKIRWNSSNVRYLANYVQSVFNTLQEEKVPVQGGTLVVSGDGRFWNPEARSGSTGSSWKNSFWIETRSKAIKQRCTVVPVIFWGGGEFTVYMYNTGGLPLELSRRIWAQR